jgi:hypothetical protein
MHSFPERALDERGAGKNGSGTWVRVPVLGIGTL